MKKNLILILVAICLSFSFKSQTTFDLTTGSGTGAVGTNDPIWQVRLPNATAFNSVPISTGLVQPGSSTTYNSYSQNTCGRWISPYINTSNNLVTNNNTNPTGIYTYRTTVTVNSCGIDSSRLILNFMAADNSLREIRINGNVNPFAGITQTTPGSFNSAVLLNIGINTVEVDVWNRVDNNRYTALQLCGQLLVYESAISQTPPPIDLSCCDVSAGQVLSWSSVAGATGYEIQFVQNDFECCGNPSVTPTTVTVQTTNNSYAVPPSFADCFSWRVRALMPNECWTGFSEKICSCLPPKCLSPVDLECSSTINSTYTWSSILGASSYDIEITYNDPTCCPTSGTLPSSMIYSSPINSISLPLINSCFSWRVRTHCGRGSVSRWSSPKCGCTNEENPYGYMKATNNGDYSNIKTSVSPNPAKEFVTIRIFDKTNKSEMNNAKLVILDISGKEIYNSTISMDESKKVDVSSFKSGMYLFRITNNDQLITSDKFIVE